MGVLPPQTFQDNSGFILGGEPATRGFFDLLYHISRFCHLLSSFLDKKPNSGAEIRDFNQSPTPQETA